MIPQPIKDYFANNKVARWIGTGLLMIGAGVLFVIGRPQDAATAVSAAQEINQPALLQPLPLPTETISPTN